MERKVFRVGRLRPKTRKKSTVSVQRKKKRVESKIEPLERYAFDGGFFLMGVVATESLIIQHAKELDKDAWLFFWLLCARLNMKGVGTEVVLNQAEIGRKMGMHRQQVQRAIKQLIEAGLVVEGAKVGRSRSYTLDPEVVFKGSAKNHSKAVETSRKRKLKARIKLLQGGKTEEPKP